ncbi:MAG TPA: hypothetical protein PLY87_00990 [Planctomycetaceae bacterium]|nr:hypothetical protein [Planctomycetaceae bacterium]
MKTKWRKLDPWPVAIEVKDHDVSLQSVTGGLNLGERELIAFLLAHQAGQQSGARNQFMSLCGAIANLSRTGKEGEGVRRRPKWLLNLFPGNKETSQGSQSRISKFLSLDKMGGVIINCNYELNIVVDGIYHPALHNDEKQILSTAIINSCQLYWAHEKKTSRKGANQQNKLSKQQINDWEKELLDCHRRWKRLIDGKPQSDLAATLHGLSTKISNSCFIGTRPLTEESFDALSKLRTPRQSGDQMEGSYLEFQNLFAGVNKRMQTEDGGESWDLGFATVNELMTARSTLRATDRFGEEWCQCRGDESRTAPVFPMTGTGGAINSNKNQTKQCRWVLRQIVSEQG